MIDAIVQWLHLIPKRFLIFCQHAQEWIFVVGVKFRKHYVPLLVLVSNLKKDQSAVALVVRQTLEVVSSVHCQETNESTTIAKIKEIDIQESFFLLSTTIFSSRIGNKSSAPQTSLSQKNDLSS